MSQSYEFKKQVIQEAQETQNATIVARRHQLNPSMLRRRMREGRRTVGETQGVDGLVEDNIQLKRLVNERNLKIAVLQDVLRKKGPYVQQNYVHGQIVGFARSPPFSSSVTRSKCRGEHTMPGDIGSRVRPKRVTRIWAVPDASRPHIA